MALLHIIAQNSGWLVQIIIISYHWLPHYKFILAEIMTCARPLISPLPYCHYQFFWFKRKLHHAMQIREAPHSYSVWPS